MAPPVRPGPCAARRAVVRPASAVGPRAASCDNRRVSDTRTNGITTTSGIRVQVTTTYLADRSSPREGQYLFAYTIRISNTGDETAQLLSRHWIITDAEGEVQEVRGAGVVGEQPVLEPGKSYEYTSYCPLKTNVGTMQGSYTMVRPGGEQFEARIAPFTLAVPNALN